MPTPTESFYASLMLQALSRAEPGQRIYTDLNAGERVCDGEVISQKSTYPKWYGRLCENESGEAIRRNLGLIAEGKENRRAGTLTLGYRRALKAVQFVMAEGDEVSLIWPDPTFLDELGRHEEAESVREYTLAIAETPDDLPTTESSRESELEIDPRAAAALPAILPFCAALEVRGWFLWPTPIDTEARLALEKVGYKWSYKDKKLFGPPALAAKLPQRPCHSLPVITCLPY